MKEMIKPGTLRELCEYIHLNDIDSCMGMNGNPKYYELKKEYSKKIWKIIKDHPREHNMSYKDFPHVELNDDFYDMIIGCTQHYYWWSHEFNRMRKYVYLRIINALNIPMELVKKHEFIKE
jgi:hypothetical protein